MKCPSVWKCTQKKWHIILHISIFVTGGAGNHKVDNKLACPVKQLRKTKQVVVYSQPPLKQKRRSDTREMWLYPEYVARVPGQSHKVSRTVVRLTRRVHVVFVQRF